MLEVKETADLQAEAKRLQAILDASPDCIKVLDLDARLLSMNAGGMETMEITDFNSCKHAFWPEFWQGDARNQVKAGIEAARAGQHFTFEGPASTFAGTPKWWEVRISPLRNSEGDITQLLAISRDVTDRKVAEQHLEASQRQLQQYAEALETQVSQNERALAAFVQFTQTVSNRTDLEVLAAAASDIIRDGAGGAMSGFYLVEGETALPLSFSSNTPPEVVSTRQGGLPLSTPLVAEAIGRRGVAFAEQEQGRQQSVGHARALSVTAYFLQDRPYALLAAGTEQGRWTEQEKAIITSVGQGLGLALERAAQTQQLQRQKEETEQRSQVLEAFAALSAELNVRHHPYELIRQAQEIVLSLLPEGHALYWEPADGLWQLRAQTGDVGHPELQSVIGAGLPIGQFPTIDRPWQTGEPEYQDQYAVGQDLSPEWTQHLYAVATLPVYQGESLQGVMNFTLTEPHVWRAVDHVVLETVQQSLSVALDRLHQQRVAQQEQVALQAFVRFTTIVASSTDLTVLARAAAHTVRDVVSDALGGFYLIQGDRAHPVFLSDNTPAFLVAARQQGVSLQLPSMVNALRQGGTVFSDPAQSQEYSHGYASALSTRFYFRDGQPYAMFATATQRSGWSEQEQAIIESVGQGLGLALGRLEAAERVQQQRDEAASRAGALEAFAVLSRDLASETDRYALVRRAQEIMLSLLTPGYALYWEVAGDHWQLKSQVGDIGDPALQRLVDEQGLPLDAPALHSTWLTGAPNYQDHYAQGADTPAEMIRHVNAATAFRVEVQGQPVGMLAIGLFDQRHWTVMDRAMLETAIHSLELVLERGQSVAALAERTMQLELANGELEAFTYSVSHDLRTPVRHVKGFAELAEQAMAHRPERAAQHLQVVKDAAERMTTMIDAMLGLSQVARVDLRLQVVSLQDLVEQAQRDAALEFPEQPVQWRIQTLPEVQGDPDTLQQVMTNLVTNAVKYSRNRDEVQVRIWAKVGPEEVAVFVQDNGAGFDPQYAGKLFGVFQRLHSQKDFSGTGIGLATVKRIVTRHGGRVWAEGKPGAGATFGFSLPT